MTGLGRLAVCWRQSEDLVEMSSHDSADDVNPGFTSGGPPAARVRVSTARITA